MTAQLVPVWGEIAGAGHSGIEPAQAGPARAQPSPAKTTRLLSAVQYTHMRLSIWPEYDDPRVLVIMEPVLDDSVRLPAKVSFLVPKGASVNMACEVAPGGAHSCRPKEITRRGAWDEISYTVLSERSLFIEYYYDPELGSPNRSLAFNFVPTAMIGSLDVEVQQPVGATEFAMEPEPQATVKNASGFTYHQYSFGKAQPGRAVSLAIGYVKDERGVAARPATAARTSGEPEALPAAGGRGLDLVVGLLGLAGLVGAVAYLVLLGATASPAVPAEALGRKEGQASGAGAGYDPREGTVLCSNCGAELRSADAECARCGVSQELACVRCGSSCGRDNEFCPQCGAELAILTRQRNITLVDANDLAERMRSHGEGEEAGRQEG